MDIKQIALNSVYTALQFYAGSGLFSRVLVLVSSMMTASMTGDQKREYVVETTKKEFALVSGILIRAIIEVILLKWSQQPLS